MAVGTSSGWSWGRYSLTLRVVAIDPNLSLTCREHPCSCWLVTRPFLWKNRANHVIKNMFFVFFVSRFWAENGVSRAREVSEKLAQGGALRSDWVWACGVLWAPYSWQFSEIWQSCLRFWPAALTSADLSWAAEVNWIELSWIQFNWTRLSSIDLDSIELNSIQLNWIESNWIPVNSIQLNRVELNSTQLNPIQFNSIESMVLVLVLQWL